LNVLSVNKLSIVFPVGNVTPVPRPIPSCEVLKVFPVISKSVIPSVPAIPYDIFSNILFVIVKFVGLP
jgi:hypothetical protein